MSARRKGNGAAPATATIDWDRGTEVRAGSFQSYRSVKADSASALRQFARSPAHYRHALTHDEDSPAFATGRAVDCALLDPDLFLSRYEIWRGGRRAGAEWEGFLAASQAAGREVIREEDATEALAMQRSVWAYPEAAARLRDGAAQVSLFWTDESSRRAKGRPDYVGPHGIVDLKTCRDAGPAFHSAAWRYGYHLQLAWYAHGLQRVRGLAELPECSIVAVEKSPPYVVQVYRVPTELLDLGWESCRELIGRLAECESRRDWPGYSSGLLDLEVPRWARTCDELEDSDLDGLGLEPVAQTEAP